jgi:hypothetical protein
VYTASFKYYQLPSNVCIPGPAPEQSCIDQDAVVTKFDAAGNLLWSQSFGTDAWDVAQAVSADGLGNVFLAGDTSGNAFVTKFDAAGNLQWTRQFGTSAQENTNGVSADGLGNVYVSGNTYGSLGGPHAGSSDAFVAKYDGAGDLQWIRQLGLQNADTSKGVSTDGLGNVYISGSTQDSLGGGPNPEGSDAFVSKYDAVGNLLWTRQLGQSLLANQAVSTDGLGNIYITGYTYGGNAVVYISKFDEDGNVHWTNYRSGEHAFGRSVSADGLGNVYVSGTTYGQLGSTGGAEAFVSKYDAAGNYYWTQRPGTIASYGVAADGLGSIYIAGLSHVNNDDNEFVAKYVDLVAHVPGDYNANGAVDAADYVVWRSTLGDTGTGLAADGNGNDEIDSGDYDFWRARFGQTAATTTTATSPASEEIPEPGGLALFLAALVPAAMFHRKRSWNSSAWQLRCLALISSGRARILSFVLCTLGVLFVYGRAEAGTLYAATAGVHGQLYLLDPNTGGVLRDVGPLNDSAGRNYPMEGLAFHPHTRVLYGATHYSDSADPATVSKLVTINPDTAEVTVVGSFFLGNPGTMTDIDFPGSGGLVGISSYGPPQWYTIDINTGISTPRYQLGNFSATEGGGIAGKETFLFGLELYVTPTASEFGVWLPCVPVHGSCYPSPHYSTISNPDKPVGGGNYGALDYDGNVLYGLNVGPGSPPQTHLVRFSGGQLIDLGRSVDWLQAIAFIPEPGSWLLAALACAAVLCIATRRRKVSDSSQRNTTDGLLHYSSTPLLHLVCVGLLFGQAAPPADAQLLEWVRQFGTAEPEHSSGVSADGLGNVYIAGSSGPGFPLGVEHAFLSKYDAAGQHQWTQHIVPNVYEVANGVSADGLGSVYISGWTMGDPLDDTRDAYVSKYDAEGALQWMRQFGTDKYDISYGVSADGLGSVYVVGESGGNSGFVSKYDAEGAHQWTRQGEQNVSFGVSADGLGNVFVSGAKSISAGADAILSKYAADGMLEWTRQLGNGIARGVSADGLGNVYVTGQAGQGSNYDVLFSKFDAAGELQWTKQFGSHNLDIGWYVSADSILGGVYLSGSVSGQGFVNKYDAEGNLTWTQQVIGPISADGLGNVYVGGFVEVRPPNGPDPGDRDVLIAKYIDCEGCEPPHIPPIVVDAELSGEILPGSLVTHQFTTSFGDVPVTWSNLLPTGGTVNPPTLSESGLFSWQTSKLDGGGVYQFTVTATNAGGSDTGRLTLRLRIIPEPSTALLVWLGICTSLIVLRARH